MEENHCAVAGCEAPATVQVRLYDVYREGTVFDEQDSTCPYLCTHHMLENEEAAKGERRPRGFVKYPHSNRNEAQGFTIYRELDV